MKQIKEKSKTTAKNYSANVIWLGIVSLLTDVSSEMIFPILPLFLSAVLKANMAVIGFIEGLAEGTAAVLKFVSGILADRFKNKKVLTILGYGASALSKPFLAFATVWQHVLIVRVLDRIGKGIRTTPRDALIAVSVQKKERGKYFGLHRALDSVGAVIGVLFVTFFLFFFGASEASYRTIFWISFIPAVLAVLFLFLFVHEVPEAAEKEIKEKPKKEKHIHLFRAWKQLQPDLKLFLSIIVFFTLGSFSYAFFLLRAQNIGIAITLIPLLYLVYNIFYAFLSYPAGKLSDSLGRNTVLCAGFVLFAITALGFGFFATAWSLWILFALYGIFIGITDGVTRAVIADLSQEKERGLAYGVYYMLTGLAIFPANLIGGLLWKYLGPEVAFTYAALIAVLAAFALFLFHNKIHEHIRKMKFDIRSFRIYR